MPNYPHSNDRQHFTVSSGIIEEVVITIKNRVAIFLQVLVPLALVWQLTGVSLGHGAPLYWDLNGTTPGTSSANPATGTWTISANNWNPLADGTGAVQGWVDGNDAIFSAGTNGTGRQIVTVSGTVAASSITVEEGALTLSGTLAPGLTIGSGGVTMLSGVTGPTYLSSFLGTVTLSGSQTWTSNNGAVGGFAVSSAIASDATTGNTNTWIISGAAVANTITGIISDGNGGGKLALEYSNSGQLVISAANSYSGGTLLHGGSGTVVIGASGALGTGAVTIDGGVAKMRSATNINFTVNNDVILGGDLQIVSAGTTDKMLTLAGPVTLRNGTRTITVEASQSTTAALARISGAIGDEGNNLGLNKDGAGVLVLSGGNTYTGDTRIIAGILAVEGAVTSSALLNSTLDMNAADLGALQFGSTTSTNITRATLGGLKGSRDIVLQNTRTTPDGVALSVGNNNANTTYSGVLSGNGGALNKIGTGTLKITGANTYTGSTTVSSGILLVSNTSSANSGTGTGMVTISSSAVLGGTGFIKPAGTNFVNVLAGGIMAPGDGWIGTLTIDSSGSTAVNILKLSVGSAFAFDLNAGLQSDCIAITGASVNDVSFLSNSINFSDLSSGVLTTGQYLLFTADISGAYMGLTLAGDGTVLGGLAIGTGLESYASASLKVIGNDIVLDLVGVPEPSIWALFISGFVLLLGIRKSVKIS